jgi:hypothetical protein
MKPFVAASRRIAFKEPTLGHDAGRNERRKCQLLLANAKSAERLARKTKPSFPEPVVDLHHVRLIRLDRMFDAGHSGFDPIEITRVVCLFCLCISNHVCKANLVLLNCGTQSEYTLRRRSVADRDRDLGFLARESRAYRSPQSAPWVGHISIDTTNVYVEVGSEDKGPDAFCLWIYHGRQGSTTPLAGRPIPDAVPPREPGAAAGARAGNSRVLADQQLSPVLPTFARNVAMANYPVGKPTW